MSKQKVFFFAARVEGSDCIADLDDLRRMAVNYVELYGESCLNDPETPSFVRQLLARKPEAEMQRAG
ncbi:MAG: hypothetical protein MUC72_05410 [Acidobacteria bacterium]|jgi:hypothetical protein|nr:hypothetical protein [Acidobacteriota bacterium]